MRKSLRDILKKLPDPCCVEMKLKFMDNELKVLKDKMNNSENTGNSPQELEELLRRINVLESKTDNDTIYNDSELRGRIEILEAKPDNDTIFDATSIENRLTQLENAPTSEPKENFFKSIDGEPFEGDKYTNGRTSFGLNKGNARVNIGYGYNVTNPYKFIYREDLQGFVSDKQDPNYDEDWSRQYGRSGNTSLYIGNIHYQYRIEERTPTPTIPEDEDAPLMPVMSEKVLVVKNYTGKDPINVRFSIGGFRDLNSPPPGVSLSINDGQNETYVDGGGYIHLSKRTQRDTVDRGKILVMDNMGRILPSGKDILQGTALTFKPQLSYFSTNKGRYLDLRYFIETDENADISLKEVQLLNEDYAVQLTMGNKDLNSDLSIYDNFSDSQEKDGNIVRGIARGDLPNSYEPKPVSLARATFLVNGDEKVLYIQPKVVSNEQIGITIESITEY